MEEDELTNRLPDEMVAFAPRMVQKAYNALVVPVSLGLIAASLFAMAPDEGHLRDYHSCLEQKITNIALMSGPMTGESCQEIITQYGARIKRLYAMSLH